MTDRTTPGLVRASVIGAAPLRAAVIVDTDSGAGFVLYLKDVEKTFFLDLHESVRESSPRRRPRT
jgi:hypothetical protein